MGARGPDSGHQVRDVGARGVAVLLVDADPVEAGPGDRVRDPRVVQVDPGTGAQGIALQVRADGRRLGHVVLRRGWCGWVGQWPWVAATARRTTAVRSPVSANTARCRSAPVPRRSSPATPRSTAARSPVPARAGRTCATRAPTTSAAGAGRPV